MSMPSVRHYSPFLSRSCRQGDHSWVANDKEPAASGTRMIVWSAVLKWRHCHNCPAREVLWLGSWMAPEQLPQHAPAAFWTARDQAVDEARLYDPLAS